MPMKPYQVQCMGTGCIQPARFKIASRWTDGVLSELKTYALSCEGCLGSQWRNSLARQKKCRTIPGETLAQPAIFALEAGKPSSDLVRRLDLENNLQTSSG